MSVRLKPRGFTLLEIVVVVTISLVMMLLIVPIFQVTTSTVKTVEKKLALYEAARNVLDQIEAEIRTGVINERGEQFVIKSYHFADLDALTDPTNVAGAADKYGRTSRREADSVHYVKMQGGGFRYTRDLIFPGDMPFGLAYLNNYISYPEAWACTLHSTLLYRERDYDSVTGWATDRNGQLSNVSNIGVAGVGLSVNADMYHWGYYWGGTRNWPDNANSGRCDDWTDEPYNRYAPGNDTKIGDGPQDAAQITFGATADDWYYTRVRPFGGLKTLDFDVAYWNAHTRRFVDVPDKSMICFSPPPKAIRVTITCADAQRRGTLTLCRVILLGVGNARGNDNPAAPWGVQEIRPKNSPDNLRADLDPDPYNKPFGIGPATANETGL